MMKIEYLCSKRGRKNPLWGEVFDLCGVKTDPVDCDISVVLGGRLENPLVLKGKKVLAFKKDEWRMLGWDTVYADILREYYDHFIDTTGLNPEGTLRLIEKECKDL
jgi:hypothetical protein